MATTAKSTRTTTTKPKPSTATTPRSDSSQVKEGVSKARNGAVSIAFTAAERAVDVPVGAVLTIRDRVEDAIEPWTTETAREKELKSLRTQVTRELNKFERRGGQARRKTTQRVRSTRTKVEREVKARRREVEKTVKQNRREVETQLKKARKTVGERVPALAS
jgi:Skp family chaperone for outer membrane proteins